MAKLNYRYGAMNSGKSDALIKTAYNYTERGLRPFVMKPVTDTRSDRVVARAGVSWPVDVHVTAKTDPCIPDLDADVVLVDEAQFLEPAQVDALYCLAKLHGVSVIGFGIRTDFQGNLFPGAAAWFALADTIEKLPTMCRCGRQAEFNARFVDGQRVTTGQSVVIDDGSVEYRPLCGECWLEES